MIPQDPLLFTGSIRENLIPSLTLFDNNRARQTRGSSAQVNDNLADDDIHALLSDCRLLDLVEAMGGLDAQLKPSAFSLGQKQLFAAARAILRLAVMRTKEQTIY